jgi:branched-subunit amino acid permease
VEDCRAVSGLVHEGGAIRAQTEQRQIQQGQTLLAALIFIACLVTAVGLTCACAEFFAQYLPFSYRYTADR